MADFRLYAPILKRLEGGFSDHPHDQGGPTNCGVTLSTFRVMFGKDKTVEDLKRMTDAQWEAVMRVYWDACKGDDILCQAVANIVVDWNVNSGTAGRKAVQRTLGLYADGIFGPKTVAALNREPSKCVFCRIRDAREQFYRDIVASRPSQQCFLQGWLNRLNQFTY